MASATDTYLAEGRKSKREIVRILNEEGKRMTIHQIAKSGEPDFI